MTPHARERNGRGRYTRREGDLRQHATPFAIVAVMLAAVPALAAELVPIGPEFRVSRTGDTYANSSDGFALDADAEPLSDGGFVVVWDEYVYNYGYYNYVYGRAVQARRFTPDAKGGKETTVFFEQDGYGYFRPDGATTPSDRYIVVWGNYEDAPPDPTLQGRIWTRRYDQALNPLSTRTLVNGPDADTNTQARTAVASDAAGGFLVVWEQYLATPTGNAVKGRKYDPNGVATTGEFQINTGPLESTGYVDANADAAGNFVVVWSNFGDVDTRGVFGQRLDPSGAPVGGEFQVFAHNNDETQNVVAVGPDGHFLVIGYTGDVTARIFDPSATPLTSEFVVNADAYYGGAAATPDDHFVVGSQRSYGDVTVQRFAFDGTPDGVPAIANQALKVLNAGLDNPSFAVDAAGDFVVVWTNDNFDYPDGPNPGPTESAGVWGRRFAVCGNGRIGRSECDDGNAVSLDGCSATCRTETCHLCTGEPSSCAAIPGCDVVCSDGAQILNAQLTMKKVGAPLGDESLSLRGKITGGGLVAGAYDPSVEGAEVVIHGIDVVYELAAPLPIPPGLPGSGCDPHDGWKVHGTAPSRTFVYKNASGALPPACAAGSANGLRSVKLKDRLAQDGTLQVKLKVKQGAIATAPPPPLTATIVLGQSPGAGAAGRCASVVFTSRIGTRYFPAAP